MVNGELFLKLQFTNVKVPLRKSAIELQEDERNPDESG